MVLPTTSTSSSARRCWARARQGVPASGLVSDALLFGARHRDGWGAGLTTLIATGQPASRSGEDDRYLALFHGIGAVADDCEGQAPRRDREPLGGAIPLDTLGRWFRQWVRVRHRTGAERTLRTAIAAGADPRWLAATTLTAVTDRYFADGGHALDFLNKAFEGDRPHRLAARRCGIAGGGARPHRVDRPRRGG